MMMTVNLYSALRRAPLWRFRKSVRQGVPKVSRSQKGGTPSDLYTKPAQPMTRRARQWHDAC